MKKTIFFDLFFTLANLEYQAENEFTLLGISRSQWEASAENTAVYNLRATGKVATEMEMIESMTACLPFEVSLSQKEKLIEIRNDRMKKALCQIHPDIIYTLKKLKEAGVKLCLVSNADIIDKKYWSVSPLKEYFDRVVFSCDVGIVKPDAAIYRLAIEKMGTLPADSIFIGDGGSNELEGAKNSGLTTVLTEFLTTKAPHTKEKITQYVDYVISDFKEILNIVKI